MTRQITALLTLAALAVLAACGATPTTSDAPAAGEAQTNVTPADSSTSRGPNLFGSGN